MASLNDHGENLTDLVLLMRVEVPQDVGVELEDDQAVAADETRHKSEHEELDLVLVVGLLQLAEEAVGEVLGIVKSVDWEEVSAGDSLSLTLLFTLLRLDGTLQVGFLGLGELGALVMLEEVSGVVLFRVIARLRLEVIVQYEEELA